MTIQFHPNIRNLIVGRGILPVFLSGGNSSVTIFSGTQPSASSIITDWLTIRTTILISYQGVTHVQSGPNSSATGIFTMNTAPGGVTAAASGTASWGIIWASNSTVNSSVTLPTTSFIVVPVSDQVGNGVIKLSTTNIVSGSVVTLTSFTINIT